jgi:tRNA-2-methylthio-N6-dimethylallyladenosine synthase
MNAHDSEIISGMLTGKGYRISDTLEGADIILFNTCSVRAHAEARVWGKVGELKKIKNEKLKIKIGILGCMAQTYKEKIFERLPHVDLVCGTANIYEIPKLLGSLKTREKVLAVDNNQRDTEKKIDISERENKAKAFVSIMEGCNNYCSYCIVPFARGPEVSRPVSIIIDEIKRLVDDGVKEVMLLGQNVNSYGVEIKNPRLPRQSGGQEKSKIKIGFVKLLEKINKIKGLERIRFMTSHPKDASLELFTAMRDLEKVCEHLHLPVQSGSNRILKLMNRIYTRDDYLRKIDSLRKIVKDCAVTTDIIVGFPSENEKDFNDTVKLMREVGFENAFIFKYSTRKGTKAALLKDDTEDKIKQQRNQILLKLQEDISRKKNEALIGKTLEVLIEDVNKKNKAEFIGHTGQARLVVFEKDDKSLGDIVNIKITSCTGHTLKGEIE